MIYIYLIYLDNYVGRCEVNVTLGSWTTFFLLQNLINFDWVIIITFKLSFINIFIGLKHSVMEYTFLLFFVVCTETFDTQPFLTFHTASINRTFTDFMCTSIAIFCYPISPLSACQSAILH